MKAIHQAPERFRTIPKRWIDFPNEVNIDNYNIIGYLQGKIVCKERSLTSECFDHISYFNSSHTQRTKHEVIHAIGYRVRENRTTMLVFKIKQIEI